MVQNISSSFLAEHGKVVCPNAINSNGKNHPTVGAFGVTAEGKFETEYIYSYGEHYNTYKFDYPNPFPGPAPREEEGVHWDVKEGIGAGPILVKKTQLVTANV